MKVTSRKTFPSLKCSILAQPAPVAALISALIDIECLAPSLAASRDDLDRYFPRGEPWPNTPPKFADFLAAFHRRSRPGNAPPDKKEARQVWAQMMSDTKRWRDLQEGMSANYLRWLDKIEESLALLPKLVPLLDGLVARPAEWTTRLRSALYKTRSIVFAAGDRPWVIASSRWTAHIEPLTDARSFLQAADFTEATKPFARAGWPKKELCREGGISPSLFDDIRKAAKVAGAKRGDHAKTYGRAALKKFITAARSGKFPRQGPQAADGWTILLDQP